MADKKGDNNGDIVPRRANGTFAPGAPGRPKGSGSNLAKRIREAFAKEFDKPHMIDGDSGETITKLDALIERTVADAIAGDQNAVRTALTFAGGTPRPAPEEKADEAEAARKVREKLLASRGSGWKPGDNATLVDASEAGDDVTINGKSS